MHLIFFPYYIYGCNITRNRDSQQSNTYYRYNLLWTRIALFRWASCALHLSLFIGRVRLLSACKHSMFKFIRGRSLFTRRVNTKHVWLQENEVTEIVHIIIIVIVMYQYASLSKMCFVYEDATIYISPMQCVAFLLINKPTVHVNWYMIMIQYSFAPKLKPNWFCWHEECMSFWMDTEHGSKASGTAHTILRWTINCKYLLRKFRLPFHWWHLPAPPKDSLCFCLTFSYFGVGSIVMNRLSKNVHQHKINGQLNSINYEYENRKTRLWGAFFRFIV